MRNTKLITISVSPELFRLVDQLAREEDRTRSGIFREAFKEYAAKKQREKEAAREQSERNLSV